MYADYDQLAEFERFGGPPFALFSFVDVEVTASNPVAKNFVLFVKKAFTVTGYKFILLYCYFLTIPYSSTAIVLNVTIPIHMRYQTPQHYIPYLPVHIYPPEVFFSCQPQSPPKEESPFPFFANASSVVGAVIEKEGEVVKILVPTGKLEDGGVVSAGTAFVTLAATAFVCIEMFWRKQIKKGD